MEWCSHCMKMVNTNKVVAGVSEEVFCGECTSFIASRRTGMPDMRKDRAVSMLMKAASDVLKATEAVRRGDEETVRKELVGTFLGLIEVTSDMGINLEGEITKKIRPEKHGKRCSL